MSKVTKPKLNYIESQDKSSVNDKRYLAEFVNIIVQIGYRTMQEQEKILKLEIS